MSVYFPQVVIPTPPPQTTLDISLTVQGEPPIGAVVFLRDSSWRLQVVFSEGTRVQKIPFGILQGEHFLIGHKYTEPKAASARLITLTGEDQSFYMDIDEGQRPQGGNGLLSGSFPLSMLTNEGNLPSQAEIRILYRPNTGDLGDGYVVATTTCNADGTWQVSGLDEDLKFDIVARIPGFNDVLISDVQPTGAPLTAHFAGIKEEYEYEEEVSIQVVALGGRPPYVFEAVSLPDGISMNPEGVITGNILSGPNISFTVKVIDSENTIFTLSVDSHVSGADPYWDKVVALLHFDGNLVDHAGREWQSIGSSAPSEEEAALGIGSLKVPNVSGQIRTLDSPVLDMGAEDFTVEFFIRPTAITSNAVYISKRAGGSFYAPICIQRQANQNVISFRAAFAPGSWGVNLTATHPPLNTWTHLAFVREGAQFRAYVGGIRVGQVSPGILPLMTNEASLNLAADGDNTDGMIGYLDEFRITKGVARYTENFIPPTEPFPNF